jgi:hypothetical protein
VHIFQSPSGLQIEASTIASDGVLDQFYQDYDAAFLLPNEKEGRDGFAECLALNAPPTYEALAERFGPFREFVLIARDGVSGPRIGGANFIAFPLRLPEASEANILTLHLNYVFVNSPARRRGYFSRLVRDLPNIALRLLAETISADLPKAWLEAVVRARATSRTPPQTLIYIEQNDPFRMSLEDYALDTKYTGLDQMARVSMWARLGARIVDFPYVQPPLSSDQRADPNLLLAVLGATTAGLEAGLLLGHLERFFGISVLKGAEPYHQPGASQQLRALGSHCSERKFIPLLAVPSLAQDLSRINPRPASFPDALRTWERPLGTRTPTQR